MLKPILVSLSLALIAKSAFAVDLEQMRKQLTQRMPGVAIGAITKAPYGDLYEVVANGFNIFYTDEHANIALIGKAIDLRTKIDIAAQRTTELMHVDFASLPLDKAIVRVKGDGSRKMAIFSDPDCPFCHDLEKELEKVTDVTIYVFLYPLTSLHPDSERKAKLLWCAKDPAKSWDEWMLNGKEPTESKKDCEAPLEAINTLALKNWITGTPGIVFSDGQLVASALNSEQIELYLAKASKQSLPNTSQSHNAKQSTTAN